MTEGIVLSGRSATTLAGSYEVANTGHRMVVSTPQASPELWASYLAGAVEVYGSHGVAPALELDRERTALVFVALTADGRPVGGMRAQGPYERAEEAQALEVWDGDPEVHARITDRLADGLVESKGLWVAGEFPGRRAVVQAFGRAPVHASTILGARHGLGTTAAHTERLWTSTGAVLQRDVPPVPYPDERYRTHLMFWDRWHLPPEVSDDEMRAVDAETAALLRSTIPAQRAA